MKDTTSSKRTGPEVEDRINDLIGKMTRGEKIGMIHSATKFTNNEVERLGIPALHLSDGPHGVREEISADSWEPAGWDNDTGTYLPVGTAQAATFHPELVRLAGEVLGAEARARGKDIILGPGFNLLRTPLCGRIFEYYSEDPWLNGSLAIESVEGIQSRDTGACIKHYALNNQELSRAENDVVVDEKTLHDHYLSAFEMVVKETGLASVMGSYNRYKGVHCCQNRELIQDILKDRWGFDGLVMTDWNAVNDTRLAVESGLDLEMGTEVPSYDSYYMAGSYEKGIEAGRFSGDGLDEKVRRILRVMFRIGVFDPERKRGARNTKDHQAAALTIARESIVLLKNETGALPLEVRKGDKVLIVGENAVMRHASGGNSSAVKAAYEVTPLEGLRSLLPEGVELFHEPGYGQSSSGIRAIPAANMATIDQGSGVKGWKARYFGNRHFEGEPVKTRFVENVAWDLSLNALPAGVPETLFSIEWEGTFLPSTDGTHIFGVYLDGVAQLEIDGKKVLDIPHVNTPTLFTHEADLAAGRAVSLRVRYAYRDSCQRFDFGCLAPGASFPDAESVREGALALAREATHVLFVGGLNHQSDLESRDRRSLDLPYGQDAFIGELLKVRPDAVITILAGSPVALPWVDQCRSLLWMSYAGMEGGKAWAEVVLGKVNPSGHLPFSFPRCLEQTGPHSLGTYEEDRSVYGEKELTGYRYHLVQKQEPYFYFGDGESYGTIAVQSGSAEACDGGILARITLACSDASLFPLLKAVQVYVRLPGGACPVLKGLGKLSFDGNGSRDACIHIPATDLRQWDFDRRERGVVPGEYKVFAGLSAGSLTGIGSVRIG
jgi:beta-glucosidase